MNTIRFRVWDKSKNEMIYDPATGWIGVDLNHLLKDDTKVFLQSMGEFDKNGKEIYVGDIVRVYYPDNLFVIRFGRVERIVVSHDNATSDPVEINGFYFENIHDHKPYFSIIHNTFGENDLEGTEIVGNIFQTPELLLNSYNNENI